jgi:DNA-binding NarL/FixJ family response regulator
VFAAIRAGARGYLLKDASIDELVRAMVSVRDGQAIFSPSSAVRVLGAVAGRDGARSAGPFPELTDRERDVLTLLTSGRSNAEIGAELQLSLKTVRNHVSAIPVKLGVRDRTQAVVRAQEEGFGRPWPPVS